MLTLRWILTGRSGVRAGWSIVIFAIIVATTLILRNFLLQTLAPTLSIHPHDSSDAPSLFLLLKEGSLAILTLGATFAMAKTEGRSLWSYGLAGTHSARNFTTGLIAGVVVFSLLVGVMALLHSLAFDGRSLHGGAILGYALFWALFYFIVGFFEEILFRGYLQHTVARGIGFWPAAICCSVAFGFAHLPNSGEDFIGIAVVVLSGIFLSLCLKITGSLWWGIGFHSAFGWAEAFLFGTANSGNALIEGRLVSAHPVGDVRFSGGAAGPEGSLVCVGLVLVLIMLAGAAAMLKRRSSTGPEGGYA